MRKLWEKKFTYFGFGILLNIPSAKELSCVKAIDCGIKSNLGFIFCGISCDNIAHKRFGIILLACSEALL